MDLEALLIQAASVDFEKEGDLLDGTTHLIRDEPLDSSQNVTETLQQVANEVAKENKLEADKIFSKTAEKVLDEALHASYDDFESPEDILINASKEVANYYEENNLIDEGDIENFEREVEQNEEDHEDDSESQESNGNDDFDDPELNSSLMIACYREKVETVKSLLKKGANHFYRDRHGWTPLMWACSKGFNEIIELLIDHRLSLKKNLRKYINAQDKLTGWTALHLACINGHKHTVELLLRNRANRNVKNLLNEKPIGCVGASNQSRNIILLLEK